jgi:hypothetical protein
MATTAVSICNMALGLLGADGTITALTDNTQNARICNLFYEPARQTLLRSHPWNFATARVAAYPEWDELKQYYQGELVQYEGTVYRADETTMGDQPDTSGEWENTALEILQQADTPINEWTYAWTLPADCLRVLYVNSERSKYRVEGNLLLARVSEVVLVYVKDIETPASFEPLFVRALAYRLGIDAAPALTANSKRAMELEDHYRKLILPEATSIDAFEAEGDAYIRSEWEQARI